MGQVTARLAWSNIRKRKSAAVALFVFVILAVILLHIGLSVSLRLGSFQDKKMAELRTPDLIAYYSDNSEADKYRKLVEDSAVVHWEDESALLVSQSKVDYGKSDILTGLIILNADTPRTLAPLPEMTAEVGAAKEELVYLPYMFQISGGYKTGDTFTFSLENRSYSFTIGGFFEEIFLGTFTNGSVKLFAGNSAYTKLDQELAQEAKYRYLSVSLKEPAQEAAKLTQLLTEQIANSGPNTSYLIMDAETGMEANRFFVDMLSAILVVFSLLLVLIVLIVIRFQILVQIEDYVINIGVLKATGYTSWQIKWAILLQFFFVSLAAGLPALAASGALMPLVGNMISSSMGLLWSAPYDFASALASLAGIATLVATVALLSARRIRLITPVNALQKGLQAHNFKRNWVPLATTRIHLQLALSLKTFFRQTRQNAMLAVIVTGLTFSSVFCAILNFNMTRDSREVINLVGVERSSLSLSWKQGGNAPERHPELLAMEGVRKLTVLDQRSATIMDTALLLQVSDDFSSLETQTVFEGRHPLYDNEISLSGIIAKRLGKSVGDEVAVMVSGKEQRYIITGLSQQISQLGMVASVTDEGFRRLAPDYKPQSVNLYLEDGISPAEFARIVEERFPGGWDILNVEEWLEGTLKTFTAAASTITWTITAVTILVVSLILYLVIKTLIVRQNREFGILKGLGFTSFHLMTQIALSFLPVIGFGVIAGSALGFLYSDRLFVLLLSSVGIHNVRFTVSVPQVLLLCFIIIVVSYIVSMLVSRRIRKISVYSLISE